MSDAGESFNCRNCGHHLTGEVHDHHGWCKACRAVVVKRSAMLALIPALLVLGVYVWVLWHFGLFDSMFVIVWIALGVGLGWVMFKVARRVLFDVIRNRGVKPPSTTT
ncbi:MAG TPA: hypothetical protein VFS20_10340 [Longimicrobium sp.]|nr:hypothetical protein [Longimicrobium sp.]